MLLIYGFLFMVFIFAVISILSGALFMFIDLPSALLIIIPLIFYFITTKSGKILCSYIKTSTKKDYPYTADELVTLSGVIKNTIKFILAMGIFCFMAGLIASLFNPEWMASFGPNFGISLLTLTYAITLSYFVFFPVQAWAENKIHLAD